MKMFTLKFFILALKFGSRAVKYLWIIFRFVCVFGFADNYSSKSTMFRNVPQLGYCIYRYVRYN